MASSQSAAVELKRGDSSVNVIPDTRTIRVTVFQGTRTPDFSIVERTTWNAAAWRDHDGTRLDLTLTGSDDSGILRFKSKGSNPEFFLVALGVDSTRPYSWCDLKLAVKAEDTAALIHHYYYKPGTHENSNKNKHFQTVSAVSPSGTAITVTYNLPDGDNLRAVTITIT